MSLISTFCRIRTRLNININFLLLSLLIIQVTASSVTARQFIVEPQSGFYQDSIRISVHSDSEVYYTLDGSVPDRSSPVYTGDLLLHETSVFKAAVFSDTGAGTDTLYATRSYFISDPSTLPVLSISTDPDHFFSDETGIYVEGTNGETGYCSSTKRNWNRDWERPVFMQFFGEDRELKFEVPAGVKIGGGCTRLYDQKSLDIYFRSEYGLSKMDYRLFPDKKTSSFDRLSLRSGGQDWYRAIIRNAAVQSVVRKPMDLGYQAFKPVAVYLNGEYWGIHMLREKQNEDFIESEYGYDENRLDILKTRSYVKEGTNTHYKSMLDYLADNDITEDAHYNHIRGMMDVEQFIDYQITEIFFGNGDWPGGNIIYWRPQLESGRWKWLLYDADMTMGSHGRGGFDDNNLYYATSNAADYYANPRWSTYLLRRLLENESFRASFIQRYSIHLQYTFSEKNTVFYMDSTAALIRDEVPRHMDRWEKSTRLGSNMNWEKHMDVIYNFLERRPDYARSHLKNKFSLFRLNSLRTRVAGNNGGIILTEGFRSDTTEYVSVYEGEAVQLQAIPAPGYRFSGWSGMAESNQETIRPVMKGGATITASFEPAAGSRSDVVINEINYHSSDNHDTDDWVELTNIGDYSVNLSGWSFSDDENETGYVFPEGSLLHSGEFLILTADKYAFRDLMNTDLKLKGDFDFALSNGGETLLLRDHTGVLQDRVGYDDEFPWPAEADGLGATLSLISSVSDNSLAQNWEASQGYGTPGRANSETAVSLESGKDVPDELTLHQNYPNPFNPVTQIQYSLPVAGQTELSVFDLTGRLVAQPVNSRQAAGTYRVQWNAEGVASGIYFYRLKTKSGVISKKMMLIK